MTWEGVSEPIREWWTKRTRAGWFDVTPIPFDEMEGWSFDASTGNLVHGSGRFFSVEGLRVTGGPGRRAWTQPVIHQPEFGVLGILVKDFDGVPHCLMQAKMEPGNINTLQLSPTVQATRSNYTRVHGGRPTRYLDHFRGPGRGEVLADSLQSEQGTWFWHKRNRNMVVRVSEDVAPHEDHQWVAWDDLRRMLRIDDLVNMDSRSVIASLPFPPDPDDPADLRSGTAHHSLGHVLSWFTEAKTRCEWSARLVPLAGVPGWTRSARRIADDAGERFDVIAVRVQAGNREVPGWTQPLLAPRATGLAAFLVRRIDGVPHLLARAGHEPGLLDRVEIAPTVQLPDAAGGGAATPFLDVVRGAARDQVRFDTVLSEEGGRFYHARTRYRLIEVGDEIPVRVPADFCWTTVSQLRELVGHGHYLNVEARTLLACARSL